jgi:deazaflavin-dependent oxidoreductase (nitroreductase family)
VDTKRRSTKANWGWIGWALLPALFLGLWMNRKRLLNQVRYFNRGVLNPMMLRTAGRPGVYDAVVEHAGRRSGALYRTPVVAMPLDEGFVIPLPYGTQVDWLRNVQAAEGATVRWNGRGFRVSDPLVLDATTARSLLRPSQWWFYRLLGISHFVRLKSSETEEYASTWNPTFAEATQP